MEFPEEFSTITDSRNHQWNHNKSCHLRFYFPQISQMIKDNKTIALSVPIIIKSADLCADISRRLRKKITNSMDRGINQWSLNNLRQQLPISPILCVLCASTFFFAFLPSSLTLNTAPAHPETFYVSQPAFQKTKLLETPSSAQIGGSPASQIQIYISSRGTPHQTWKVVRHFHWPIYTIDPGNK
jgi:hypothetical protein